VIVVVGLWDMYTFSWNLLFGGVRTSDDDSFSIALVYIYWNRKDDLSEDIKRID
jgi:hypothetical protein